MRQNLLFLTGILGGILAWGRGALIFGGTEFSGGTLARYNDDGVLLFVVALVLTLKLPRIAAATALTACCLSLLLYAYLMFPRPFRQIWPGEWKVLGLPRNPSFGTAGGLPESSLLGLWHRSPP
jgi:hypothetical protein